MPYRGALRPGTSHHGHEVLADLVHVLREFRPTRVFVSHPADHHPDHEALYLFTRVALWELRGEVEPRVHPYLIHYPAWSLATGFRPERSLDPPAALATAARWQKLPLEPGEVDGKRRALEAHRTQFGYSARRLLRFVRVNELFGDLPPLAPGAGASVHGDDEARPELTLEAPDLLSPQELAEVVDVERWRLRLPDAVVEITVDLDRVLEPGQHVSLHLLGARDDRRFAEMPKIEVSIGSAGFRTLERGRRQRPSPVRVARCGRSLEVRVPRDLLGDPDRMFVGARASSRATPLDRVPWRIVELPPL